MQAFGATMHGRLREHEVHNQGRGCTSCHGDGAAHADAGGDPELLSANGEVHIGMEDGVQYVLRFGEALAGSTDEDSEGENRYLFAMARVDMSKLPAPELEDLPEGGEASDDDGDDGKSAECEALHAAAKQAHADWKAAWHAARDAAKFQAEHEVIAAEAKRNAAEKETAAKKMLADAVVVETAAPGLGEMQVRHAEYELIEQKGSAEARVLEMKHGAEAKGTREKAEAMKILDAAVAAYRRNRQ